MDPSGNWKWRARHGRETYAGQLERTAAKSVAGETYERRWHDAFVNGQRTYSISETTRGRIFPGAADADIEFRPELPAPRARQPRANPFYDLSAEDKHTARLRDPTAPNYFSDAESERTGSVAEDYKEAERAEKAATGLDDHFYDPELRLQKENRPPPKRNRVKFAQEQQQAEQASVPADRMAGRGRGRPGQLKGVTWEYDPSIKLESKPIELFPVHTLSSKNLFHVADSSSLIRISSDLHPSPTKRRERSVSTSVCRSRFTEGPSIPNPQSEMPLHQQRHSARINSINSTAPTPGQILIHSLVWRHIRRDCSRSPMKFLNLLVVHSVCLLVRIFFVS